MFLIGGGRDPEGVRASHRPFLEAVGGGRVLCVCLDDEARWLGYLDGSALRGWNGLYCGYSAGAAVAARSALVGGWKIGGLQVCEVGPAQDVRLHGLGGAYRVGPGTLHVLPPADEGGRTAGGPLARA